MHVDQKRIVLAGRTFVRAGESTVEQDSEFLRLLMAAGLADGLARADGETDEQFAWRLLHALIGARVHLQLIGCLIVPEEHAPRRPGRFVALLERLGIVRRTAARGGWSPEVQAATVEFLKQLDEPADKQRVYALVAELLFPFLLGVRASWLPSPRSSSASATRTPENERNGASTSATGEG